MSSSGNNKTLVFKRVFTLSSVFAMTFVTASCNKKEEPIDNSPIVIESDKDLFNATINSLVATDVYGRSFDEGDVASSDKKVGMFYFVWHGMHVNNGIFDVTKLNSTEEGRQLLWTKDENDLTNSPLNEFHYYDEPLYGYYCSDDPWVLAKHVELLTMSGIDYISLDLTNISIYEKNVKAVLETLLKYQQLGWRVPLVTSFITGTDSSLNHPTRVLNFYNLFMTDPRYDSLWLRDELTGKPILEMDRERYYTGLDPKLQKNIKFRNSIWPFDKGQTINDDASWLDWCYPQRVYNNSDGNYMSVSVAQHVAGSFGMSVNPNIKNDSNVRTVYAETYHGFDTGGATNYDSNRGRGWDYELNRNVKENVNKGTNLEAQWGNALNPDNHIDEVFVTGWNEWVAYKLPVEKLHGGSSKLDDMYGKYFNTVSFCDTCDDEFSRDLEMTKEGYGDNFYLQNMRLARQFKDESNVKYAGKYATEDLRNVNWQAARTYLDFTEDAFARDFDRADHKEKYINETNRNDIKSTKVSHDANNLYIQIETKDDIVIDHDKTNNLNVLLSINGSNKANWEGYNFILNRNDLVNGEGLTSLEEFTGNEFETNEFSKCNYFLSNKTLSISIPLENIGVSEADGFSVDLKVADGISEQGNMMNYYIDGDVAPIGRLNYRYNSEHY